MFLDAHKREQILPEPVVLISTIGKDGVRNIAPWSNITPILRPLDEIILASWIKRDTLNNIRDTKEFVVNIPSVDMVEEVMICSKNYPSEEDEFEHSKLKSHISKEIKTPGIEGCLAWAECKLVEEIKRDKYSLIIGKVVSLEANDSFFNKNGEMDYEKAKPLSIMLGDKGMYFTHPIFAGRYAKYSEMFMAKKDEAPNFTID